MRTEGDSFPWIALHIKNVMRARDFHKKKAVKFDSQLLRVEYKEIRYQLNSEPHKAKKNYFCHKFEDCTKTKDLNQSWHHINLLPGWKHKPNNILHLKKLATLLFLKI